MGEERDDDGAYAPEMVAKLLARQKGPLRELPSDDAAFIAALLAMSEEEGNG